MIGIVILFNKNKYINKQQFDCKVFLIVNELVKLSNVRVIRHFLKLKYNDKVEYISVT